MKVIIEETGNAERLTILDKNGIDWTADFINAGSLERNEDGTVILSQEEFDWWWSYINERNQAEEERLALLDDLRESGLECPREDWWVYLEDRINNELRGVEFNDINKVLLETLKDIRRDFFK